MRQIFLALLLTGNLVLAYSGDKININLYLKNGEVISGHTDDTKENAILSGNEIKIYNKIYRPTEIDSFRVNSDLYLTLIYQDTAYLARPLFKGEVETYRINARRPVLLIRKIGDKEKFMEITEKNKYGVYNYFFKECLTRDSGVLKKRTNGINDYVLTNEVVNKLNCNKQPYTIFKKQPKTQVYIGAAGGISILKPLIKSSAENYLANSKKSPKVGYFVGIAVLANIKKHFDFIVDIDYAANKSTFEYEQKFTSPITYTASYSGAIQSKAANLNINFRYRFLKTNLSPFILFGLRYSHKFDNKEEHSYTNNFNGNTTYASQSLQLASLGLNIGAGANYDITKRMALHLNVAYNYGVGIRGPLNYKIREGNFYTELGFLIRVNKL